MLTPVFRITPRPFHSKQKAAAFAKFNAALDAHDKAVAKFEQHRAQLRDDQVDVGEVDFNKLDDELFRNNELSLLQGEFNLRREYAGLEEEAHAELLREVDAAFQRKEEKYADVLARLISIGYVGLIDAALGAEQRGRFSNGTVRSHPSFRDADDYHLNLQAESMQREHRKENERLLERIERQLQASRNRLLGIAEPVPAFMKSAEASQSV